MKTIIRPLIIDDAKISYKWRNNSEIWKFTGRRPDRFISYKDELKWIKDVLARDNEKRFAIVSDDHYVGNIQLTGINRSEAFYHIFIGEKIFWGQGIGYEATKLILTYAFQELKLDFVKLQVRVEHENGIRLFKKNGFQEVHRDKEIILLIINKPD